MINVKITIFHVNEEKRIKETFIFALLHPWCSQSIWNGNSCKCVSL